jgi:hypothetical protein
MARRWRRDFWSFVDRSDGLDACWSWTGARDKMGYGRVRKERFNGEALAHRYVYSLAFPGAPMPEAVLHECDNSSCVNPLHLTGGTRLLNNQQAWERGLHSHSDRKSDSRLTTEQVAEIRERANAGERQSDMAREFGVNQGYVSQIVNFKRRKAA